MTQHTSVLAAAVCGLVATAALTQGASYTITNLAAAVPGAAGLPSRGAAINALGQVAGYYTSGLGYGQTPNPFVYTAGVVTTFSSDPANAQPVSISSTGAVVLAGGALYRPGLGVSVIPPAANANSLSGARGVNAAGLVVGSEYVTGPSGYNVGHPFVYNSVTGVTTDIPNTALGDNGGAYASGAGINAAGHIVGTIGYRAPGATYSSYFAYLATPGANGYAFTNVGLAVQNALGGTGSSATAVSDNDIVTGINNSSGGDQPYVYANGVVQALGVLNSSLAYQISTAEGVNSSGVVVGQATYTRDDNTANRVYHAYAYLGGVMTDLNTLLPAGSGWELTDASGINDAGQITGVGTYNGLATAFLLNPTAAPEPATLGVLATGGVLVLRRRRA